MPRFLRRLVVLVACSAVVGPATLPAWSLKRPPDGGRWPRPVVTYFDATGWRHTVAEAAGRWNRLHAGVVLRRDLFRGWCTPPATQGHAGAALPSGPSGADAAALARLYGTT
jgi:hypothetical protein